MKIIGEIDVMEEEGLRTPEEVNFAMNYDFIVIRSVMLIHSSLVNSEP